MLSVSAAGRIFQHPANHCVRLVFQRQAWEDVTRFATHDRAVFKRLTRIVDDALRDPFAGIGKRYRKPAYQCARPVRRAVLALDRNDRDPRHRHAKPRRRVAPHRLLRVRSTFGLSLRVLTGGTGRGPTLRRQSLCLKDGQKRLESRPLHRPFHRGRH